MLSFDQISKTMTDADIKPSVQRIKILEYLISCNCHPTADQTYVRLSEMNLGISKATVYNTLNLFANKNLVRTLTVDNNEKRYDATLKDHGHFICESCDHIINFSVDSDKTSTTETTELEGYTVKQRDVYYRGICKKCLEKKEVDGYER